MILEYFAGNHAIESSKIEKVMDLIDRKYFISKGNPYEDSPQYIGYGGTISAPHMVLKFGFFKGWLEFSKILFKACICLGTTQISPKTRKPSFGHRFRIRILDRLFCKFSKAERKSHWCGSHSGTYSIVRKQCSETSSGTFGFRNTWICHWWWKIRSSTCRTVSCHSCWCGGKNCTKRGIF